MNRSTFSDRLKSRRIKADLTQSALAQLAKVSNMTVSRWERGLCLPQDLCASRLAQVLGCDVNWLLSGGEPDSAEQKAGEAAHA